MSEANKYTLYGALFGLCFPIGSIAFLYVMQLLGDAQGLQPIIVESHRMPLLWVIDTAPFFLGLFARLAGMRQDRIQRFSLSLEREVAEKTESLRRALDDSRKANEMIAHMADHDSLTGLLNRRRFQQVLDDWIRHATRYGRTATLVFIDIDDFKPINDTYGHVAGDDYLMEVAGLLKSSLRSTDHIARWGGDEFAVLLPETVGEPAQQVANKLLSALARHRIVLRGDVHHPSASVGLADFPEHATDAQELVASADAAMYQAKKAGRGCWRLYAASADEIERVQEQVQWEARIRRALENDQFILFYQPLLDLKTGRTDGYEALLRMEDRDGQLLSPGLFLESAERFGLSSPIDFMVIRKAARRLAHLHEQRHDVGISLNLSSKTLQDPHLLDHIQAALRENGTPNSLRFEITEATALAHLGLARELALRVRELGASLILDDFGLGPAMFQYLQKLSVDMVKIDASLVRALGNVKTREFVKSLTDMAHGFDVKVAAKFVEDERTLDMLRELGIDYAQGFAVGRPMESIEQVAGEGAAA